MADVVRDTNPDLDAYCARCDSFLGSPDRPEWCSVCWDYRVQPYEILKLLAAERVRREKAETALRRIEEKARSGLVYVDGWTNDLRRHEIAELARAVLAGEGDEQQ